MEIEPFALERYFARYEFSARYLLSSSDCESLSLGELLALADPEAYKLWLEMNLGYTESQGHPLLRGSIAETYSQMAADNILVLVPEEGIFLLMHALLKPGDHVVCTFPAYQSLFEVARSIGCQVDTWEPLEKQGWVFDVGQLERRLRSSTKLVVVNFPHNPTGFLPSRAEYERIVEIVRERGIHLLSDEMYRYLEIEPGSTLPAGCDLYEKAISLAGLSKSYGLPGLRIGWIATKDTDLLQHTALLKDYTTICSSAPSEVLALIALRARHTILEQQLKRVRANLSHLDAFFERNRGYFVPNRPLGGSICFPRMLGVPDTDQFCRQLVERTGIMLVPSSMFLYGDQHVRIGFGRQDLPDVLDRFERYLATLSG